MIGFAGLLAALAAITQAAAPPAKAAPAKTTAAKSAAPAAKPVAAKTAPKATPGALHTAPNYAVVEGVAPESTQAYQSLTILCPAGLKAFGAGFSAVVKNPPAKDAKDKAQVTWHEEGLDKVRSYPDGGGSGWRVEGSVGVTGPWRIAGRVVCARAPS